MAPEWNMSIAVKSGHGSSMPAKDWLSFAEFWVLFAAPAMASGIWSGAQEEVSGKVQSLAFGGDADADYLTTLPTKLQKLEYGDF